MIVLAIDPSGSFKYGSGTSGWCVVDGETKEIVALGNIKAKDFKTREEYFDDHKRIATKYKHDVLVIENFILYKNTASSMFNQELETSELIGVICDFEKEKKRKIVRQNAQQIKTILKKNHILLSIINEREKRLTFRTGKKDRVQWFFEEKRISNHIVDAIRHAFYYITKQNQGEKEC
ncbi:MAG: hypothetical protein EOM19_02105 [Candidatus Moranbacteria bacterium]|nr:hypothetical protein [Candidatus Moranbacteria bacterium]